MAGSRSIEFDKPWGGRSWLVKYSGPYDNDRPPHVEVGAAGMDSVKAGQVCTLTNLRRRGRAVMWDVVGVKNGSYGAHFTVYFGNEPDLDKFK